MDIYGLLTGTNCGECGERSCLAFALLILQEKHRLADCLPLYQDEFVGKRHRLEEIVEALGLGGWI